MNSSLLLNNKLRKALLVLLIVVLLLLPGQVFGLGHESLLPVITSEGEPFVTARVESPDMVLARFEAEGASFAAVGRVESPDMVLARVASESAAAARAIRFISPDMVLARIAAGESAVVPGAAEAVSTGVNYVALFLVFLLVALMAVAILAWERIFHVKEVEIDLARKRCSLVSASC